MADLQREIDLSVVDAEIEALAQDTASLVIHAHNALGVKVARMDQLIAPVSLSDRMSLLVFAVGLLRCHVCSAFASEDGRFCPACAPVAREMES